MLSSFRAAYSQSAPCSPSFAQHFARHFASKIHLQVYDNLRGPKVAIVGRPNVGKSTLFNRLSDKSVRAIVDNTPGVTRDRKVGQGLLANLEFTMVDTPGFEELTNKEIKDSKNMKAGMIQQTKIALETADVALFMVDAKHGVTSDDEHIARWLRKSMWRTSMENSSIPEHLEVILVVNKSESYDAKSYLDEFYSLAFGEPVFISALHDEGSIDLFYALDEKFKLLPPQKRQLDNDVTDPKEISEDEDSELQMAVIGRPNVGKSTIINSLLSQERVLTGPTPGVTRDSIAIPLVYKGHKFKLIDTAGLAGISKRSRHNITKYENLAMEDTLKTIKFSNVVCLVTDVSTYTQQVAESFDVAGEFGRGDKSAQQSRAIQVGKSILTHRDLTYAGHVLKEGRALVIVANKWDLLKTKKQRKLVKDSLKILLETTITECRGTTILPLSALTGDFTNQLLPEVTRIHENWNKRIGTGQLNKWLQQVLLLQHPPSKGKKRSKIRYMTQIKSRPPTFVIFCGGTMNPTDNYLKYLEKSIRRKFQFHGVPIRLVLKRAVNPYVDGIKL